MVVVLELVLVLVLVLFYVLLLLLLLLVLFYVLFSWGCGDSDTRTQELENGCFCEQTLESNLVGLCPDMRVVLRPLILREHMPAVCSLVGGRLSTDLGKAHALLKNREGEFIRQLSDFQSKHDDPSNACRA